MIELSITVRIDLHKLVQALILLALLMPV